MSQFIILRCLGRTQAGAAPTSTTSRDELVKDIQEKKLRILMTNEFDRLREVAQVDNFLAGTSQSGKVPRAGALMPVGPTGGTPTGTDPARDQCLPAGDCNPAGYSGPADDEVAVAFPVSFFSPR